MTERVEPLTTEEIAELRRLSDATGAAEAEAEHLGTNYSNRKAEAAEFHRDKAAGPALARLLDIADDYARLAERCKEHEQFRHQHRDCDKMGCENQALRAQLDAANARIEKLERVRKAAQSLSLAVDDPHACAVIDSDNRLLKAALAALAACDEEGGK